MEVCIIITVARSKLLLTSCTQLLLSPSICTGLLMFSLLLPSAWDQAVSWQSAPLSCDITFPNAHHWKFGHIWKSPTFSCQGYPTFLLCMCVGERDVKSKSQLTLQGRQTWPSLYIVTIAEV
ncbi:hypothetical protein ILYODFUR_000716 [Ilyodon furcidens]|uniref:Uncharacterized protein n=1 Tax=Ilyodon furcidens TaxID=33524 RepID=A0ABV0UZ33_9TELE